MEKHRKIIIFNLIILISFGVVFIVWTKWKANVNNKHKSTYDLKEWAYYNCGQPIKGNIGVKGVDINIKNVNKLIGEDTKEVLVAIVDTGIYFDTTNDKGYWRNSREIKNDGIDNDGNGYIDDCNGWDFYNDDESIYDNYLYDYHGTYIANTIQSISLTSKLIPCKFLSGTIGDTKDAVKAIKYAIDNGATIINCSWNFENKDEELYKLMKNNSDVLFVCAAGNSNLNFDENNLYPVSYKLNNVISVMSINNEGIMYEYSGYGKSVDIAAPGKDVYVAIPEKDKTYVDGTSVSAAFVTGTAALMKSIAPNIEPVEIKSIIVESAHRTDTLSGKCGAEGYLDVYNSVKCVKNRWR